jgi:hypothetical protein
VKKNHKPYPSPSARSILEPQPGLPDLHTTLADYLTRDEAQDQLFVHTIGGQCHASHIAPLPFNELQIWVKV